MAGKVPVIDTALEVVDSIVDAVKGGIQEHGKTKRLKIESDADLYKHTHLSAADKVSSIINGIQTADSLVNTYCKQRDETAKLNMEREKLRGEREIERLKCEGELKHNLEELKQAAETMRLNHDKEIKQMDMDHAMKMTHIKGFYENQRKHIDEYYVILNKFVDVALECYKEDRKSSIITPENDVIWSQIMTILNNLQEIKPQQLMQWEMNQKKLEG